MKLSPIIIIVLFSVIQSVLSVSIILERRAPNLQISLHEVHPNEDRWHFGLLVYAHNRRKGTMIEYAIDTKTKYMGYQDIRELTKQDKISVPLLAANGEGDNASLLNSVKTIIKRIPKIRVPKTGEFKNCFDFVIEAVSHLKAARYISNDDYQRFARYYNEKKAEVRKTTDSRTIGLCYPEESQKRGF